MNKRHRIWAIASMLSLVLVLFPSLSSVSATPTGLTGTAGNQSVALSWTLPGGAGFPISFNGTTYNEVYVGSNSFLTFGGGSSSYSGLGTSNPALPSVHICAGDWSYQTVQFRIDNSVTPNQLRIRYQGTASRYEASTPNMIYEAVFFRNMSYFDLLVGTNNACSVSSSKLLTNGSTLSTPVSFAANTNWRITGLSASLNGSTSSWLGSSNSSVPANSNGWTALVTASADDSFVSSALSPTYAVQVSSNGGSSWGSSLLTNSTSTNTSVTGLTNGTSYVFRVAPYYSSSATTGQWSSQSPSYTPASFPPGQPTSLVATSGNGRATLSWVAPSSVGDSAISGYRIEYSTNGGGSWLTLNSNTWSTSTSQSVTGLTNGTSYSFRVAAINSSATGSYSATASATPALVPPGQPTSLVATSGNGRATLSWVAPSSVGDSAISGYRIEYSTNGGGSWLTLNSNTWSTSTSQSVTGLTNGTSYSFRVAAINSSATGSYSASATAVPVAVPPGQPTSLVATSGNGQVSLSWVAPSSVGDSAISGYRIEYSSNGGGSWSTYDSNTWSTSRTRTVAWLTNGTSYSFRVAAINSSATGSYSASATAVPKDPNLPAAPSTLTASPGDGQTVLQWSPVSSPYLNGYRIEYSSNLGSSWWTVTSNTYSTSTTRTITGLANGTSYMFRVAAVANYYGRGDFVSASVVPTRSVTTSQNKSTTINSKTKTPKTKYVSKNFASGNTRLSLSSVMKSANIGMSGMRSLSGSVQSYFGEPCRVSGKTVLRGDRESSCVVRVTMKKSDGSTVVATVTIRGSARTKN